MNKTEINQEIQNIIGYINIAKENISTYLNPYTDIKEYLEKIQSVATENGIDVKIKYEKILNETLRSCIIKSTDLLLTDSKFNYLKSDLCNWKNEETDKENKRIAHKYISAMDDITDIFDVDIIECQADLENQLSKIILDLEYLMK